MSALMQVLGVMGNYAVTIGAAGTAFAATECMAESVREKKDVFNGALGAAASGMVLGVRVGRIDVGLGAAAAMAVASMAVDASGETLRGPSGFGDGAAPKKKFFPY